MLQYGFSLDSLLKYWDSVTLWWNSFLMPSSHHPKLVKSLNMFLCLYTKNSSSAWNKIGLSVSFINIHLLRKGRTEERKTLFIESWIFISSLACLLNICINYLVISSFNCFLILKAYSGCPAMHSQSTLLSLMLLELISKLCLSSASSFIK